MHAAYFAAVMLMATALAPREPAMLMGTPADSTVFRFSRASHFDVVTGKAGLFGFAGHRHRIRADSVGGEIVYYADSTALSHVTATIPVTSLQVLTPHDTSELRQVREAMLTDVLHPDQHANITFDARLTSLDGDSASLMATLTLEGVSRTFPISATLRLTPASLVASSRFTVKQSDFGIKPYSGGPMGTVKVADAVTFEIEAVAVRAGS
ncbi:MAG TPA: YceI family protein [Gemmatimonadales bacterium]|nr:YceI family protein [Gemmatimonadales bacterium]